MHYLCHPILKVKEILWLFLLSFLYLRAWCNGSIRVSKTFDLGSNPSARANFNEIKNQK